MQKYDKREIVEHRDQTYASTRKLSPDYEQVGVEGEIAFHDLTGIELTNGGMSNGSDGGFDFKVDITIDVKSFQTPYNLLVEQGKVKATIYVLCKVEKIGEDEFKTEFIGWAWAEEVLAAPVKDFGRGVINHYIPAEKLHKPTDILANFLRKVKQNNAKI